MTVDALTDFPDELSRWLVPARIISSTKSRLGGHLYHLSIPELGEAFLKVGETFDRLELLREHRNLQHIKGYVPAPMVVGFHDDGERAHLLVTRVPGTPLHEMAQLTPRTQTLDLLIDILTTLWSVEILTPLPEGLQEELGDIKLLLEKNLLDVSIFRKVTCQNDPSLCFTWLQDNMEIHELDVLTHGDMCLPNILVDDTLNWAMLDWGKAGIGDRCRDLAALEGSLERNIDSRAFEDLLIALRIDCNINVRQKLDFYNFIDAFWYSRRQ